MAGIGRCSYRQKIISVSYTHLDVYKRKVRVRRHRDHALYQKGIAAVSDRPGDRARLPALNLLVERQLFVPNGDVVGGDCCFHQLLTMREMHPIDDHLPTPYRFIRKLVGCYIIASHPVAALGVLAAHQGEFPPAQVMPLLAPGFDLLGRLGLVAPAEVSLAAKADMDDTCLLLPPEPLQPAF